MKVLVGAPGPHFSVHDVYVGWCEALAEYADVITYNLGDRLTFYDSALIEEDSGVKKAFETEQAVELAVNGLYAALYKCKPDVLLAVSGFFYHDQLLDLARSYGTKVVLLHTESPYEDARQLKLAAHADLNILNDPTNIETFQEVAPTVYMPHAYRPSIHHPGEPNPDMKADLAFVGTGYPSRIEWLEAVDLSGLDVLLAGNWQRLTEDSPLLPFVAHEHDECLDNEQTAEVYRSAKIGLNLYRKEAEHPDLVEGWAMGPREVEMAACGMFFLRDPRGESDQVLGMLPIVGSPEETSDQIRWWLAHDDERRDLAVQAREAIADRTFSNSAAQLLRLLDM